jgi:ATP-binding cassette subfamily C protein
MHLLLVFARAYPYQSAIVLGCLLLAAVFEGIGFSSLVPLLSIAVRIEASPAPNVPEASDASGLEQIVVDTLAVVGLQPTIGTLCLLVVCGMLLKAMFVLLAQRQVGYTVAHVATDLRLSLLRSLLAARWEYYTHQPVGGFANAFATEATRAAEAYLFGTTILSLGIQSILYLSLACAVSWQATLGAAGFGLIIMLSLSRLVRISRQAGNRQTQLLKTMLGRLTDVLYAVKPLKAMARETLIAPLLEKETQRLNKALRREVLSREILRALQEPLLIISLAGGLYLALTRWSLSLETVVALALLFERTLKSLNKVQRQYQRMAARESAYWSLQDTISKSEHERETLSGRHIPHLTQAIRFQQVSFGYGEQPILQDASFHIPAHQLTTIIGPSGAGKTSTVDLIVGLIQPHSGSIWIDAVPLDQIDMQAWRWTIGYVPQEMLLLHDSVFINVTLGDPRVTQADAQAALQAAGAWEFIARLPDGMNTLVGERGSRFSGGQRQRIAIARALVHTPQLLILDEATTSLDPDSEASICATVQQLCHSMTILAISHQPALLDIADQVYHLEGGRMRLVERHTGERADGSGQQVGIPA